MYSIEGMRDGNTFYRDVHNLFLQMRYIIEQLQDYTLFIKRKLRDRAGRGFELRMAVEVDVPPNAKQSTGHATVCDNQRNLNCMSSFHFLSNGIYTHSSVD